MTTTKNTDQATRATYKGHGSPETFFYFGYRSLTTPNPTGTLARIVRPGMQIVDAETGVLLNNLSSSSKFWAAPAPKVQEYNAVAERLARVFG